MNKTLSRLSTVLAVCTLGLGLGLGFAACKQGDGEVCQINSDCSSNSCNAATGKCQTPGARVPDAAPIVDASAADAPVDAAPDAAPDAAADATAAAP